MSHEKIANGLAWIAAVTGTTTAGIFSTLAALKPQLATLDANAVSTAVVVGTSAASAVSGALMLIFGQWRKKRREEKVADDAAFAASWEGKFAILQTKYDLLTQSAEVTAKERDFLRLQLSVIQHQNESQTRKLKEVAENVIAVGKQINAPMSDDGEGTDPSLKCLVDEPEPKHEA